MPIKHPALLKAENERLRGLLHGAHDTIRNLAEDLDEDEDEFQATIGQIAEIELALGHQQTGPECEWPTCECALEPERCKQCDTSTADTYTAVDMATAAAQGFRDEQAAVEPAAAQDERKTIIVNLQRECARLGALTNELEQRLATRPAQTEQQPVAMVQKGLPELLESVRLSDEEGRPHGSGATYWNNAVLACQVAIRDAIRAAPIAQPYPNRVAPHIDQFAEGVFVWYDEAALPGGAEPTLQAAQQAMAAYGEHLNGPDNGGVCQTCGGDLVGDGYSTVRHCENLDVIGEGYEPDAGPLHCQEPTNG